jgi:hypothetical protein
MVPLIWLALCLVAVFLLVLAPGIWLREIYSRYSGGRPVVCPENHQSAAVNIDVRHAAITGMHGRPEMRLCDCTRWPQRALCGQGCLRQAIQAESYTTGEVKPRRKQIYHLPVMLAAFAAWYVGALWHSQYLFRARWMEAVGLSRTDVSQAVRWIWPHLLAVAALLLFAYGVAWLLAVRHRKGVLQGVLMSALLCAAIAAAASFSMAGLPHDLLLIEAGYAILATLLVGAIVGGLYDKLVLPSP